MRQLPTGVPVWDLAFDEKGQLTAPAQTDFLDEMAARNVTDLFVFSHGWGAAQDQARQLYDVMFPMIRYAAHGMAGLAQLGFACIYWPSLWSPPTPATAPPSAGSAQADTGALVNLSAGTAAVSGTDIATALRPGFADPAQQDALMRIGRLIDEGEAAVGGGEPNASKQQRLQQIGQLIKSLVPPAALDGEYEDSGETVLLLTDDAVADYQAAANTFGSGPSAGAEQGIGDWFAKAINGAKDVVRVLSYAVMKDRAGNIGRDGLGPLLAALHSRLPAARVHLIRHSFGGRLVSFTLSGVGTSADSPVASPLLLQGAFSHWSFAHAQDNPFGSQGALNTYADRDHGPLVATYTVFDRAVGVWYPKPSFLAQQDTSAVVADRWGGMGADGFQAVNPSKTLAISQQGGTDYGFSPHTFYRMAAAKVINNTAGEPFSGAHSDIKMTQVAQLAAATAAAHD